MPTMTCNLTDRSIDGGYGWVVVLSSFCLIVITDGIFFSFGNLLIELIEYFDQDRASTALIGSLTFGIACFIGPLSGGLCEKFGCRIVAVVGAGFSCFSLIISTFATSVPYLYMTYGILGGTGLGFMYLSANVIVVQYFDKFRGLACGITTAGAGVGMFVFNLFTRFLLNKYGWRGTVLIEAGICLQGVVFGLLLLSPQPQKEKQKNPYTCNNKKDIWMTAHGTKEREELEDDAVRTNTTIETIEKNIVKDSFEMTYKSENRSSVYEHQIDEISTRQSKHWPIRICQSIFDLELLTNLKFWIFILSSFAMYIAYSAVVHLSADRAVSLGMTKNEASWLASSIGISSTVSRVLLGWVADRNFVSRIVMLYVLLFLAGLSTVFSFLVRTFATTVVYASLYGFFTGGYIGLCPTVLADLFSAEMIAKSFGLNLFCIGIAGAASTPLAGLLYDKTGNYDITFVVAGSELIIAGLLVLVLRIIHLKKRNSKVILLSKCEDSMKRVQ